MELYHFTGPPLLPLLVDDIDIKRRTITESKDFVFAKLIAARQHIYSMNQES